MLSQAHSSRRPPSEIVRAPRVRLLLHLDDLQLNGEIENMSPCIAGTIVTCIALLLLGSNLRESFSSWGTRSETRVLINGIQDIRAGILMGSPDKLPDSEKLNAQLNVPPPY